MVASGSHLIGAALVDDTGAMTGSVLIVDFPDRSALDTWLAREPYMTAKVWQQVDVKPCRLGPSFGHLLPEKS